MSGKITRLKLINQTNKVNIGTVFWFHGSGDTGDGLYDWIKFFMGDFEFPHLKCVFPTAPLRPYTAFEGTPKRIWFDREAIDIDAKEHTATTNEICEDARKLIDQELQNGVAQNKIIVGGFSMGGTVALHLAYRVIPGLAGCFVMSSFLNNDSTIYKALRQYPEDAKKTPLLMFHGRRDTVLPFEWGKTSFENLTRLGVSGEFRVLPNLFHEISKRELVDLFEWLVKIVPVSKSE